jgi:anhydro-N-acetylmuramic acid kinase
MSGTSLDGIDAALIETDGEQTVWPLGFVTVPYEPAFRQRLRACFGVLAGAADPEVAAVEQELTALHAEIVALLLKRVRSTAAAVHYIGFHGQTLWHKPHERRTCQLGDGAALAKRTGIAVVNDFRTADVHAGGQGAPLVPLYHAARAAALPRPLVVLNIGGVANITALTEFDGIIACDTGPGNALLDDWMLRHTGTAYDADGTMAAQGTVDAAVIAAALALPYFQQPPPKSLDRNAFAALDVSHLTVADGAATLAMLTAATAAATIAQLNQPSRMVLVTGGGRHHPLMLRWLAEQLAQRGVACPVLPVEAVGWNGDALEAEAFAYLAIRHVRGLPLSLPTTTGVPMPLTGGRLHRG